MASIALLGLGAMGSAMAARWRAGNFPLAVWNRNRAKAEALAASGVQIGASPRAAATHADIVVSMVVDDDASREVWLEREGALAGLQRGAVAIEASTISPGWARDLGALAEKAGAQFLDAPVGGGPSAVASGSLAIFVGGSAAALDAARPALAVIASRIEHMGDVGAGATWKLINYMMAGAQLASLAEALTLAEKAGIAPSRAADLIRSSVVASPAVAAKLPRMIARRFSEPDAALRLVAKDQRYALDLARSLGAELEVLPVVAAAYARAEREGLGDLDLAAILESIGRRSAPRA
jgi:3-hydroxyisobutyrate dehydrogenase-like beta-hydroxyacid dehydrogenase